MDDQTGDYLMKPIDAAKFKKQCLALLDCLTPEGLIITKQGKPVAKVMPFRGESKALIGSLREKLEIHGDLESTGVVWDAAAKP